MRPQVVPTILLATVLGCSRSDPAPTEGPQLAVGPGECSVAVTVTPSPSSATALPNTTGNRASFTVKNNCGGSPSGPWDFTQARTGQVTLAGTPSPAFLTLTGGTSKTVSILYNTGAPGSGTVSLDATHDGLGPLTVRGTQNVTVTAVGNGVPFGPADLFNPSRTLRDTAPFSWTMDLVDSVGIISQISTARANHIKFAIVMTGGGHGQYLTDPTRPTFVCPNNGAPGCKFDLAKWKAVQNRFNTSAIKQAVANGVADGTILFAVLMDEPNHSSWGGVMTHALVDQMSQYTKSIFPTLRTGIDVTYTWQSTSVYSSVDVMTTQYAGTDRSGTDPISYRTAAVNSAKAQKVALFFSINVLNGGDDLVGCPQPSTGGPGTGEGGCKMTAAQVQSYGDALLGAQEACGLKMWTWDLNGDFMTRPDNKEAFDHLAVTARAHAPRPCVKPL